MTYDKSTSESSAYTHQRGHWHGFGGVQNNSFAWAKQPGFHPLKALTVVGGLIIFPPLGILALGYFLWNAKRNVWGPGGPAYAGGPGIANRCGGVGRASWTGNSAFDERQAETIKKLHEERQAFNEFRTEQSRKRDQESFDTFRTEQTQKPSGDKPTEKN